MRRVLLRAAALPAVLSLSFLTFTPAATGDTPGCVSHTEFDNMVQGLSPGSVANRFDTDGWYIGENDSVFKRGYEPCWDGIGDANKKVVVAYDLDSALSKWWDVRDQ